MKSFFTLVIGVMLSYGVFAQGVGIVRGTVIDEDDTALPFATVILLSAETDELVKAGYTNDDGEFILTPLSSGKYKVKVTYTSRADYLTVEFILTE